MSITVLAQFISCVCSPDSFDEAVATGYREIYVMTTKGTFKHHILRGENRHVCVKVDSIPGYKEKEFKTDISSFLPAGKIPHSFFLQIEKFFREVIRVKGTALEAMIFIMWNKDQGYFLHVPTQTVSGASVNYDYEGFPSASTVVVNIHSHGHMNAFFSGTDDTNDSTKVQYSGVFGKFQDKQCTTVWRFNYYTTKFTATPEDIFQSPAVPQVEIPAEWVNKVDIRNVVATMPYGNGHYYRPGQNLGNERGRNPGYGNSSSMSLAEAMMLEDDFQNFNGFGYEGERAITPSQSRAIVVQKNNEHVRKNASNDKFEYRNGRYHLRDKPDGGTPELTTSDILKLAEEKENKAKKEDYENFWIGADRNFAYMNELGEGVDEGLPGDEEGVYEELAINHGIDVADAWITINEEMNYLNGKDEIVNSLALDLIQMASEEGQAKIFKDLFEALTPRQQEKIQTAGI